MKTSELRKFAGTKTKGLPTHKEEVEQVDELSKATLGSYIKKAATDVATNSAATGRHAERSNKIADHQKKTGDYSKDSERRKDSKTADKAFDKSWKRRQGINKATDKLTKEDVQVDEVLDTNIKKFAYLMKAKKSIKNSDPNDVKQANDIANRTIGAKRLMNKLTKKKVSEGVEQVNELSTDTYHSAAKKAAKKAMGDAQGRSGPIFKKYAGMANKFRDKGMSQEKKEKAMKEETLDEIQGTYGNGGNKKNLKIIHKGVVVKDYGTDTKPNKATRDKKAEKMKAYRAERDKNMEEEIQIDEISKGTLASYGYKAGRQMQGNQPSDPDKFRKRTNREKGSKLAYGKYYGHKVKVPATEEVESVDELSKNTLGNYALAGVRDIASRQYALGKGDKSNTGKLMNRRKGVDKAISKLTKEATENPMAKQLADKKAAIQKTIVQKKMQVMQSKANKQMSSMKEGKCSCTEGKKSMTCETHGDKAMGMKGGKEPIQMNPPLRD
jgi:hypothetical protein